MRKIAFNCNEAKLKTIRPRKDGAKEEPHPRLDMKFEGHCDGKLLQILMGSDNTPPMWTADGGPLYTGISSVDSKTDFEGAVVQWGDLEMTRITLKGVDVNKFKWNPISGHAIKVAFWISVRADKDAQGYLLDSLLKSAPMYIEAVLGYKGDDASHIIRHANESNEDDIPDESDGGETGGDTGDQLPLASGNDDDDDNSPAQEVQPETPAQRAAALNSKRSNPGKGVRGKPKKG
jgi:hypothetical protein